MFHRILFLTIFLALTLIAQEHPLALTGARIIPIAGPEIAGGVLVVQGGKVQSVGPAGSVAIPANADRIDASGKVMMPGIVDSHSHIGGVDGGDRSSPIQPDVRILDSFNARDARVHKASAGGITTVQVVPGSGHLLSGHTLYLKLRRGDTIDDLLLYNDDGTIAGGIKMANGTNSRRDPPFPGTRAKSAALVRAQFIKAQEYQRKIEAAGDDPEKRPARDLGLEMLAEALAGKRIIHHHTHRHDDIVTVLRLQREFDFKVVLHHVSDAWAVAEEIAEAGVGSSIIVLDSPGGKIEAMNITFANGAALEKAGALVGFHSDDGVTDSRLLFRSAGLAVRAGMSRKAAIEALTISNARLLELEDRVGSLEPGKDADFILLSGDPLSIYTHVLETWVEGRKVFDRSDPKDRLYAVGGYGASHDQGDTIIAEGEWQ